MIYGIVVLVLLAASFITGFSKLRTRNVGVDEARGGVDLVVDQVGAAGQLDVHAVSRCNP